MIDLSQILSGRSRIARWEMLLYADILWMQQRKTGERIRSRVGTWGSLIKQTAAYVVSDSQRMLPGAVVAKYVATFLT